MALVMQEKDVSAYRCDLIRGELFVTARSGTIGMHWPQYLEHGGIRFKYDCNEPMDLHMAGHFGGHARYVITH